MDCVVARLMDARVGDWNQSSACRGCAPPSILQAAIIIEYVIGCVSQARDVHLLKQVLGQADRLNSGHLDKRNFTRVLTGLGASLHPGDVDVVAASFARDSATCDYLLFVRACREFVPSKPAFESMPLEKATPEWILQHVKAAVEARKIDVELHFAPLQKEGAAAVPIGRFVRVITAMQISISREEAETMSHMFETEPGMIDWRAFVEAVKLQALKNEADIQQFLDRLKAHVSKFAVSFASAAAKFDRGDTGRISAQQFAGALKQLAFEASRSEIALAQATYGQELDWKAISAIVDVDFQATQAATRAATVTGLKTFAKASQVLPDVVRKALALIQEDADTLFDLFERQDRRNSGTVPVAVAQNIIKLGSTEQRALESFYRGAGGSAFDYLRFVEDVRNPPAVVEAKPAAVPKPESEPRPVPTGACLAFIKRFKVFCSQRGVTDLKGIFAPYEAGRAVILLSRLVPAFGAVQLEVSRAEIQAIAEVFRDQKRPELLNYVAFCVAVEEAKVDDEATLRSLQSAPISFEVERIAGMTCCQLREKLQARNRTVDQFFTGITSDTITSAQFEKALNTFGFVLQAGQTQALQRKYRANLSDEVDWRRFCADVKAAKPV